MCSRNECISILKSQIPYLQTRFGVVGLTLFGSMARGDTKIDSDVDLLVEMPPKIVSVVNLKAYLEELLNTSVDIIRKHSNLSSKFIKQIDTDGIRLL